MIGKDYIEIGTEELMAGMASSDFTQDGGFSNLSEGVNLTKVPGLMYFSAEKSDQTDELTGILRASCEDPRIFSAGGVYQRVFVDSGGAYYGWNGTLLDKLDTDATNPTKYSRADMIAFGEDTIYTTNEVAISSLAVSTGTLTDAFFVFAGSTGPVVPHPALVFENNAYYGNGNTLLRQTAPGATPAVVLTLPTSQTIVALGIDPGTGRMLLSIIDGLNASGQEYRVSRVGYYDGFSNKLLKVIIVDDMVTAFYPVGAIMYIGYGTKLGIWNGAGIQFLRDLDIDLTSTGLAYKQHFTNIDDTLYVVEGHKILAYGEVVATRPKCFWYAFVNKDANFIACDITVLTALGSGLLGFGWTNQSAAGQFATLDTTSVSTLTNNLVKWYSLKYLLPKPMTFNAVTIEYGASLPTSNVYGDVSLITISSNSTQRFGAITNTLLESATNTASSIVEMNYAYPNVTTRSLQLTFLASQNVPIRRITIFFNPYD